MQQSYQFARFISILFHPLLIPAVAFFLLIFLGVQQYLREQVAYFIIAVFFSVILIAIITQWWKVSVHTTAISGPLVALLFHFGSSILPFFLLVPLVGWSRISLQRHTTAQVVAGAAIGLGLTALQLAVLFFR